MLKQFLYLILNIIQIILLLVKVKYLFHFAMKKSNNGIHFFLIDLIFLSPIGDKIIIFIYFK